MKRKFILIVLTSVLINTYCSYAQKYSNIEQYKKYYKENKNLLDNIEGIYTVFINFTIDGRNGNRSDRDNSYTVAIIKENHKFIEYRLKDGVYEPTSMEILFYKYNEYTKSYKSNISFNGNINMNDLESNPFSINNNRFKFKVSGIQKYNENNFNTTIDFNYVKTFPLETDY